MAQKSIQLVDSYSVAANRWLLRWSLWEAGTKKCYICEEATYFKEIQIDHVIPQDRPRAEFDKLWAQHGGAMANMGVHHISNLRACCRDCNSARLKGKKLFSPSMLDLHLKDSPAVMKQAFRIQKRIRRNGDIGESLVKVATAETNDDYDLLWDSDINQAVLAALHAGSDRFTKSSNPNIHLYIGNREISLHVDDESPRMLAAVQLATGVPASQILVESVLCAIGAANSKAADFASMAYEDFQGVSVGTSDWHPATEFSVSVDDFNIDMHTASCMVTVKFCEYLILPLAMQSPNGERLEDDHQSEQLEVGGTIQISATLQVGHNPTGKSGLDVEVEDESNLSVS